MTTRELILAEIDHLGDDKLETVYSFLKRLIRPEPAIPQLPEEDFERFFDKYGANLSHYQFNRKEAKERRIRCPVCGWQPDGQSYWGCEKCHAVFDTFETHAHCPNPQCGNSWTFTQCIFCDAKPPHEDWYEDID